MAEDSDSGEKTEAPTGRRTSEARADGMVGKSVELSQVCGIVAAFIALQALAPHLWQDLLIVFQGSLTFNAGEEPFTIELLRHQFYGIVRLVLPHIMLLMVLAGVAGGGVTAMQTKFLWSSKLLKPKFSHLNPITGIKRLFSIHNLVNVGKSILKLIIIAPIAYSAFFDLFPQLMGLMDVGIDFLLPFTSFAAAKVFWRIISLLLILAIADFIWQKYHTMKKLKMTKVEIKEEKKSVDGDEQTRLTMRSRALQRARDRMMQSVPKADVVVTNPTHLAVALSYKMAKGSAPKVIAKGRGFVAERIKEIAKQNGIPVIERKPLARALFKAVEVGQQIPYELYSAVAELLAYVYRLKGKRPFAASSSANNQRRV